ncbi:hypothetical protein BG011_008898 [Mortierella polycephala]|uniref:Uncharacterized protein n=1 Tax=Mortierella polycephala TaxID=41804 RepID=A0A9P6Q959_9FUNG|nr:hypothetical protein BG011_008898 [Mortierella polycephala]
MASIMPFPNVATHRRMPHLPMPAATPQQEHQSPEQNQTQERLQSQSQIHTQEQEQDNEHLRLPAATPSTQHLLETSHQAAPQKLSQGQLPSSTQSALRTVVQDTTQAHIQDSIIHLQSRATHGVTSLPHGQPTSLGSLSPISSSSSPGMSSHDSNMIKTAFYDAFGCLYHPSAHAKHSLSPSVVALRSGDVTPLMGLSPKGSPLLRPNLGPSAPITPLELADEASAPGYFGLHVPLHSPLHSTGIISRQP